MLQTGACYGSLMEEMVGDPEKLLRLLEWTMPFGKYTGLRLIDLPEPYVVWFHQNGLPKGQLGEALGLLYEIKVNGLESLVRQLAPQR